MDVMKFLEEPLGEEFLYREFAFWRCTFCHKQGVVVKTAQAPACDLCGCDTKRIMWVEKDKEE